MKIFPDEIVPNQRDSEISLFAAKNEYESFQLILRSDQFIRNVAISVRPFKAQENHQTTIKSEIFHVEYVTIQRPSDSSGHVGEWPDPLPPYDSPFHISPKRNYPLWITVYVPPNTPAGEYQSQVLVRFEGERIQIPVKLTVWDFQLPAQPTLRSGFGLSAKLIAAYHNLSLNSPEMDSVLDKYYQNFKEHRICPYNPMMRHTIASRLDSTNFADSEKDTNQYRLVMDFKKFDRAAARYLDQFGFNSFRLPLEGVPRGSFHSRTPGRFKGFSEKTQVYQKLFPEYLRQVTAHLSEKQWLDQAYVYWFDEPQAKDYQFVTNSNRKFRKLAPGLKLFLTEEPHAELAGSVDIWCLAPQFYDSLEVAHAKERGEEVWWYLCTNPKTPYVTLFIDAAAINLRMWLWMTWKYQLNGILVWQAAYWNSETAFGKKQLQNPWLDPMAYLTGYGVPQGEKRYWGNGDGRFLYPPNRDINYENKKFLAGPINSIRWELLREGIEDYEYFHLLQQNIALLEKLGREKQIVLSLQELVRIPQEIIRDLRHFTLDPNLIYTYRKRLAQAIIESNKLTNYK